MSGRDKLVAAWESELAFTDALISSGITLDETTSGREALCAEADDLERRARIARSIVEASGGESKPLVRPFAPSVFLMSREMYEAEQEDFGFIHNLILSRFYSIMPKDPVFRVRKES